MQLARNFKLEEFIVSRFYTTKLQGEVWVSYHSDERYLLGNLTKLARNLQVLRDHLKQPVSINIAYRPEWYEASKGRSGRSKHCLGKAADIRVEGFTPKEVAQEIENLINAGKMNDGGIGLYKTFVHYDIRAGKPARWTQ